MINWKIPRSISETRYLDLKLEYTDRIFILGANGSGKSALLQDLRMSHNEEKILHLPAFRKTWFENNIVSLRPDQVERNKKNLDEWNKVDIESRWKEPYEDQFDLFISDFVRIYNKQNKVTADRFRIQKKDSIGNCIEPDPSILDKLNYIMRISSLNLEIELSDHSEILARKGDWNPFNIKQLSDGERSAVYVAIGILVAEPNTIIIIDEPERHLHSSITIPFLSSLFESQTNCLFVVATHEVTLPMTVPNSKILMVKNCNFHKMNLDNENLDSDNLIPRRGLRSMIDQNLAESVPSSWDINEFPEEKEPESANFLPEHLKKIILGTRTQIVFIEGDTNSLDNQLFNALFSKVSLIPVGGCDEVKSAVSGINNSTNYHHVTAIGLIDRDFKSTNEVKELKEKEIYALNYYSIESIYYSRFAIGVVANLLGMNESEVTNSAIKAALETLKCDQGTVKNIVKIKLFKRMKDKLIEEYDQSVNTKLENNQMIEIKLVNDFNSELEKINGLIDEGDWESLVKYYPIHKSAVLGKILEVLGLRDKKRYVQCFINQIYGNSEVFDEVHKLLGDISKKLKNLKRE